MVWEMLRREDGKLMGYADAELEEAPEALSVMRSWEPVWGPLMVHSTVTGEVIW